MQVGPSNMPKGDVFKTLESLYSKPLYRKVTLIPKQDVFIHDEKFTNMVIEDECIRETAEDSVLPSVKRRHWNGHDPAVDCKHVVRFDVGDKYKNQSGKMSCIDIMWALRMSMDKKACGCDGYEGHKACMKRQKVDGVKCDKVTNEVSAVERHCIEHAYERLWAANDEREGDMHPLIYRSDYVRVERVGKKRKRL